MTCLAIHSLEEVMETAFERWSLKIVVRESWISKKEREMAYAFSEILDLLRENC